MTPVTARLAASLAALLVGLLVQLGVDLTPAAHEFVRALLEVVVMAAMLAVYGPLHKWLSRHHIAPPTITISQPGQK